MNPEDVDKLLSGLTNKIQMSERAGAVSVWRIIGTPKTKTGQHGAWRGTLFLMPVLAEAGAVMSHFITECSRTDSLEYESAEVERTDYVGWAWLPGFPIQASPKITEPEKPKDPAEVAK